MNITTVNEFRTVLKQGHWAWPGGYPMYFICADGEALSFKAAKANRLLVESAIKDQDHMSGWCVIGYEINWEDPALYCSHTNKRIDSAYAEDEVAS